MRLVFKSRTTTTSLDWSEYALLRDNVQHYLESLPGDSGFSALHKIERAVDGKPESVNALALRHELQQAWAALAELKLAQSAVSLRTHAILAGCDRPPPIRGTVLAKAAGWSLPIDGSDDRPLRSYLAGFIGALLRVTDSAATAEELNVTRADDAAAAP